MSLALFLVYATIFLTGVILITLESKLVPITFGRSMRSKSSRLPQTGDG
jgi:hypothetical protein